MRWAKTSLRNSFFGWKANTPAEPSEQLELARNAMLQALDQGSHANHATLERKVLFASSIEELWYMRPDLMNAIAAAQGETAARCTIEKITLLFEAGKCGIPKVSKRPIIPRR